jgi:hypothetical protein
MSTTILPHELTAKELKDSELVTLHRTLFMRFIKEKIESLAKRKLVERLYDSEISKDNIRIYYNAKIKIFAQALVTDELESIAKHSTY